MGRRFDSARVLHAPEAERLGAGLQNLYQWVRFPPGALQSVIDSTEVMMIKVTKSAKSEYPHRTGRWRFRTSRRGKLILQIEWRRYICFWEDAKLEDLDFMGKDEGEQS